MTMNTFSKRIVRVLLVFFFFANSYMAMHAQVKNRSGEDSTIFISGTVFVPKYPYTSGAENWGIDAGDINKDGKIDLVSCSKDDAKVNVHLNDGSGKFGAKQSYTAGKYNRAVHVFDANKDGWLDVATVSIQDSRLNWFINDGRGGLQAKKSVVTGTFPHDVTSGDVNQDGFSDLVTVLNSGNKVMVHYGDGSGNFLIGKAMATGIKPRSVLIEDIDGNGIPDIVVGCDQRRVYIHPGTGGGKFGPKVSLLSGGANWGLGTGDFNGDGKTDIATASYSDNKMCVHISMGAMKFERAVCIESGDYNFGLVTGDFDMDGDVDIVTASTRDEVINVHLNDGTGTFAAKAKITSGNWNSEIVAADLDGDGDMDIATSSIKDNNINIHRNKSIDPEEKPTSTCIYGKVLDKDTKKPLVAIVAAVGEDGLSIANAKTDKEGNYKLCGIPFGSQAIKAKARGGYPQYQETVEVPESAGKEGVEHNILMEKPKGTFIYGKISDIETKEVLPGASLVIKDINGAEIARVVADAQGKYKQELPFGDAYNLTASFEKYNEKTAVVSLYPVHYPDGVEKNFELQKIKPKTTACVKGYVRDEKTKEVLPNATVTLKDADGNIIKQVQTDEKGFYEACAPFGEYEITGEKKGYFFKIDQVNLRPEDAETGVEKDLELTKLEVGMKIVLKNIYYDVAKATLRPESMAELDRLIVIMNQNPTLVVELGGHTDSDGSESYNKRLSQNRAQSVVDYLTDANIGEDRLVAKGYGESEPIVPNNSKENKQLNRRTEFKVLAF